MPVLKSPIHSQEKKETKMPHNLKRKKKTYHGYKAHIGIDNGTKVIHSAEFTPANVHDSTMFHTLLTGKEKAVLADKDYAMKSERVNSGKKISTVEYWTRHTGTDR